VANHAARIDPSTAKPTVEPIARCALMIPDAMPARSGGTAVMASDVIGVRQSAPPRAAKTKPTTTATMLAGIDTIMIASPVISDDRPTRIGSRVPTLPTKWPAFNETIVMVTLNGSSNRPVSVGE